MASQPQGNQTSSLLFLKENCTEKEFNFQDVESHPRFSTCKKDAPGCFGGLMGSRKEKLEMCVSGPWELRLPLEKEEN